MTSRRPQRSKSSDAPGVVWPVWVDEYNSFSTGSEGVAADLLPPLVASGGDAPMSVSQALLALLADPGATVRRDELLSSIEPLSFERWMYDLLSWVAKDAFADGLIWAIRAIALVPTDLMVMQLGELTLTEPSRDDDALIATIELLESVGSDHALYVLHRLETHLSHPSPRDAAAEALSRVATRRHTARDDLVDLCVPRFGLDERGEIWLDFGPRKFKARLFDLDVVLEDESGERLDTLPKPRKSDDGLLCWRAVESYRALTRGLKSMMREYLRRLEGAMVRGTRWAAPAWAHSFGRHPILNYFARTLVWAEVDASWAPPTARERSDSCAVLSTFRASSLSELCSISDDPFVLRPDVFVTLVHRLLLTDEQCAAWGAQLADYQQIQPIEQLQRETFVLGSLSQLKPTTISPTLSTTLARYGWAYSYSNVAALKGTLGSPLYYKIYSVWGCIGFLGRFEDGDGTATALKVWRFSPPVSTNDITWFAHSGRLHDKIVECPLDLLPATLLSEIYADLRHVFDDPA